MGAGCKTILLSLSLPVTEKGDFFLLGSLLTSSPFPPLFFLMKCGRLVFLPVRFKHTGQISDDQVYSCNRVGNVTGSSTTVRCCFSWRQLNHRAPAQNPTSFLIAGCVH